MEDKELAKLRDLLAKFADSPTRQREYKIINLFKERDERHEAETIKKFIEDVYAKADERKELGTKKPNMGGILFAEYRKLEQSLKQSNLDREVQVEVQDNATPQT